MGKEQARRSRVPRKDLEQQGRHEQEVVPAHQDDLHVRPPPAESFQVAGGGDSAEAAAEDQDAFLRCRSVHRIPSTSFE